MTELSLSWTIAPPPASSLLRLRGSSGDRPGIGRRCVRDPDTEGGVLEWLVENAALVANLASLELLACIDMFESHTARIADGVVVGSTLVNQIAEGVDQPDGLPAQLTATLAALRSAMDAG